MARNLPGLSGQQPHPSSIKRAESRPKFHSQRTLKHVNLAFPGVTVSSRGVKAAFSTSLKSGISHNLEILVLCEYSSAWQLLLGTVPDCFIVQLMGSLLYFTSGAST